MSQHTFGLIILFGPPSVVLCMLLYRAFRDAKLLRILLTDDAIAVALVAWALLTAYLLSGSK